MVTLLFLISSAFAAYVLKFSTNPSSIALTGSVSVTVIVYDTVSLSTYTSAANDRVFIQIDSGGLGGTISDTLASGSVTIGPLTPHQAGTRYLVALCSTTTNYDPVVSSPFVVTEQSSPSSAFVASPSSSFTALTSYTFIVTVNNQYDMPYITPVSVSLTLFGTVSTAVLGGTTTLTTTSSGTASFSLSIDSSGTFYLYPTVGGSYIMCRPMVVTVTGSATPVLLKLTNPGSIGIGQTFSVTVTLYSSANAVASVVKPITLSLSPGTLSGYSGQNTASGITTFSGLSINPSSTAGTFTLTATDTTEGISASVTFVGSFSSTVVLTMTSEPHVLKTTSTYAYSVSLSQVPTANVQVDIVSGTTSVITVSPASLTFTIANFNTPQPVTLTILSGGVTDMTTPVSITHSTVTADTTYSSPKVQFYGCDSVSTSGVLTVTVVNTFTPGTLVFTGTFYVVEGSTSSYTVALSIAPSSTVTVTPNCPSSHFTCSPASLSFTNGDYSTPQTITVTGVAGASGSASSVQSGVTYTLSTTDPFFKNAILTMTEYVVISTASSSVSIVQSKYPVLQEKLTSTYTISLGSTPSAAVSFTLTPSSAEITVSPASFSLSSTTAQTITVTHVPSSYPTAMMRSYSITHATTSTDPNYDSTQKYSIAQTLPVYVVNPCNYGQILDGTTYTCGSCPEDYKCDSPISLELCSVGEYSPSGQFTCIPCPPGFYCNPNAGGTGKVACASGSYSLGGASACITCSAGTACLSASMPPADCPQGTYSLAGATSCTQLTGSQVGGTTSTPTNCLAGTIPAAYRTHCESCPPGHECTNPTTRTITPCALGYFSAGGASACTQCPAGSSCSRTEVSGVCPSGYYSEAGQSSCIVCPEGFSCTGGSKSACSASTKPGTSTCAGQDCPAQYYCISGLPPIPCPPGYISAAGAAVCTACATGEYQDGNSCVACPAGYFCATPVGAPIPCPLGTYSGGSDTSCTICSSGYMCAQGSSSATQYSCPPGFDCTTIITAMTGVTVRWPVPCAPGKYNNGGTSACSNCVAGYYCPGATAHYEKFKCPPGHYCPAGASEPTECTAGKSNPNWGSTASSACTTCAAGYFSNVGAPYCLVCPPGGYCSSGLYNDCPSGKYLETPRNTASSACKACPKGYYCSSSGTVIPSACPVNTLTTTTGKTSSASCTDCPAGYNCPLPASNHLGRQIPCRPGYYCAARSNPTACAIGKYSDTIGASVIGICLDCPAGFICSTTATTYVSNPPLPCPQGTYCPAGSSAGTNCAAGTYSDKDYLTAASECSTCPAGYTCAAGSTKPSICHQGYYCPRGSSTETQCPTGTYNPYEGVTNVGDCLPCPVGHYCAAGSEIPTRCAAGTYSSSISATTCTNCPAGYYCPLEGWINPKPCNKGYYSSTSATVCTICTAGYYCPLEATLSTSVSSNECPAGLYCPAGTDHYPTNLLDRCPAGKYCTLATSTPTDCPTGTLRRIPGAAALSDCISVEPGYYVSVAGSSAPTGPCSTGYYCTGGSISPTQFACTSGTYRLITGATSAADCGACPAGAYCGAGTSTPTACPAGQYCAQGSNTPTDCPIGTYSPGTSMYQLSDCIDCPKGYYCATAGMSTTPPQCSAGYYCVGKAIDTFGRLTSGGATNPCPTGGYCPAGTPRVVPCPVGKYMPSSGNSADTNCQQCPSGSYCAGATTAATGLCDAGYYCTGGASTSKQNISPAGSYSAAGASASTPCAAGTYNPAAGQSSCLSCPAGFYCQSTGMTDPVICPAGNYCPINSINPIACSAGTYNAYTGMKTSSGCIDCQAGYACTTSGMSSSTVTSCSQRYWCYSGASSATPASTVANKYGPCPAGNYCPTGSSAPRPCPPGTFTSSTLQNALSNCGACTAGKYCQGFGNSAVTGSCEAGFYCPAGMKVSRPLAYICPAGSYCVAGSSSPASCAAGTFQENQGQSSCSACPAGYFCPSGTSDFSANICPVGHYCPANTQSNTQYPCPIGTYNPVTGAISSSFCISCDAGKYCGSTGLSVASTCNGGYICKGGATTATPNDGTLGQICSLGYYCPAGGSQMIICKAGYYCATTGLATPTAQCSAGYYCISGAISPTPNDSTGRPCSAGFYCPQGASSPTACPAGKYNPSSFQSASTACLTCPQGYYCEGTGLSTNSGACTAGFWCPAGSVTSRANICAAGSMCPAGAYQETNCGAGTYQPSRGQSTCITCPIGYYCNAASLSDRITPTICPAGSYCPSGTVSGTQYLCPAGKYSPAIGRTVLNDCLTCPAGQFCGSNGLTAVSGDCTQGYYCTAGSSSATQNQCQIGYYCPTASSIQIPCQAGKYCNAVQLHTPAGDCTAGYYCTLTATTSTPTSNAQGGSSCPAGYYCPTGSFVPTSCPIGTYNPSTQQTSSASCLTCPAGSYCNALHATSVTGSCRAGFFCVAGSITDTPALGICPIGSYCPTGSTAAITCPAGTFGNFQGKSLCDNCPQGFTCQGGTNSPVICPIGYYCTAGLSSPIPCAPGTYNPFTGQSVCMTCPIGFYCDDFDAVNTLPISVATVCTSGFYCPGGSKVNCPAGTYSEILGLQAVGNCKPCSLGKYCTVDPTLGGVINSDCTAGHYCVSGNSVPNPSGIETDSVVGILCPTGYYCLAGVTQLAPCPFGKFTTSAGASQISQCTDCTAGYYCIPGDPNPYICPLGSYCPVASQTPVPCPVFTYSNITQASASTSCKPCPAGYLCEGVGIGLFSRFPCPFGQYCLANALVSIPCPLGTWGPTHALGSADSCYPCPAGSYCNNIGLATIIHCPDWSWCPQGSSTIGNCPGGSYCHQNTKILMPCYGGYYCPETSTAAISPPYRCEKQYYCPPGSSAQIPCPDGTVYVENSLRILEVDSCVSCAAGTYSTGTECLPCYAGFVCVKGASRPDPQSLETDGGYPCPAGYYCPEGSGEGLPCPVGHFYSDLGAEKVTDCRLCLNNTYSDVQGQSGCYPCGPNARADVGSTTCYCLGLSRSYMKRDGTCRCVPGYSFYLSGTIPSDEDSAQDCVPTVLPICATGYFRSHDGTCVASTQDCTQFCNGNGTWIVALGICTCHNTYSAADVCDSACQASTPKVKLDSSGMFIISDPSNYTTTSTDFKSSPGFTGNCYCNEGYNCDVKTISLDSSSHSYKSDFQPTVITGSKRKLATEKYLENPVICLEYGDTMIFSIPSKSDYPVYYKDSLLNTNPKFDYGPFLELKKLIEDSSQNITSFAYTFVDAGSYVFTNSNSTSNIIVISVMSKEQKCPDPYMRELTASTLSKTGVYQSTDVNIDSNWLAFFFLVCVFILFILVITIVNVFKRRNLKKVMKKNMEAYREMLTRHASLIKMQNEGKIGAFEGDGLGRDGSGPMDLGTSINPQLFEDIYRRLGDISNLLKERAHLQKNMEKDYIINVSRSLKEMKGVIASALNPSSDLAKKQQLQILPNPEAALQNLDLQVGLSAMLNFNPSDEPETQKLIDKIVKDPALADKMKQELLDELNNNFANLEAQLAEDRVQAANTLKSRIDQRNRARRELMLKKQKLEEQERNLREEMQREVKDAESMAQQVEKDFEKDKRRAREKEFGTTAKNMRKDLLEKIRKHPESEEQLLAQYEKEMAKLESNLDDEKGRQYREMLRRIEERKNERKRQAQIRSEGIVKEHHVVMNELDRVNKQIDLAVNIESETHVEISLPKQIELSEVDERNIDRKFNEKQKNIEIQHDSKQSQLEKQKQKLTNSLSAATTPAERDAILEQMRKVEADLQEAMNNREADQRRILADRLKERRRLRREKHEKHSEAVPEFAANTVSMIAEDKFKKLQQIVANLSENEKIATIKQMLADKHDQELIELQSKQQKRAALLHSNVLREALENKAEASRLAPGYLSSMNDEQQKQAISAILLESEKETQTDFQKQWKEHQRRCNDELLKLLDFQMKEVGDTMKKLGIDSALNPEAQELDREFRARQSEMEREAQERLIALERQRDELNRIAREKQQDLEQQIEAHKKQAEIERAKRELELKQRREMEEKVRKGEMTKKQMEDLIAQHQKELSLLESTIQAEKNRQMEILRLKIEEKKNRRIKALQVPEDLKHINLETAQLLKGFRGMRHEDVEFDQDILAELLRRVTRIEQVVASIDERQFANVMNRLKALKSELKF